MRNPLILARKALNRLGADVVRYRRPHSVIPGDIDSETAEIVRAVRPYTMTSNERIASLCEAVRYVSEAGIPGDFVECGVWRGGSMMAAAHMLLRHGYETRDMHLFDTYEGMTPPTDADIDPDGVSAESTHGKDGRSGGPGNVLWRPESVEGVREALRSTGYDLEKCHFIKGPVEETIPTHAPSSIAILRLDTDWYESTRHELIHLFPRVADGGVVIIDDYGYWKGARKAVDEYLSTVKPKLFLHRVDDCARIVIVRRTP